MGMMAMMETEFLLRRSVQMMLTDPVAAGKAFHAIAEATAPLCSSCKRPTKHRLGVEWCQDRQMSERKLQDRIVARAKRRGWTVAHAGKGWVGNQETGEGQFVTPMMPGWPDLFLLNPNAKGPRAMAIECKREDGVVSPEQFIVLRLLNACGVPAVVVRPSDLRKGRVSAIMEGR